MPYMLPPNEFSNTETANAFERFNQIVENYKHIIENNATARCMIGFTAAAFIRNEGDIDIGLVEIWLQSLESDTNVEQQDEHHVKVNRILHVVKETSTQYYIEQEDIDSNTNESEDDEFFIDNADAYKLNRFTSGEPYTESYCRYLPKETTVVDHVLFPLEEHSTWSC